MAEEFSIVPYAGNSPMKPWPSLAANAFSLQYASGETIFFYDSPPGNMLLTEARSAPVYVLIHGLGDEADSWRHIIPLLNDRGFRVLALDLPGFGRSAAMGKINMKTHAEAVLKFIKVMAPGNKVFLAGSSMGGIAAESAAFRMQDTVKGLVLIDGSIPGGPSNPGYLVVLKILLSRKWYKAYRGKQEKAWRSLLPYYADLENMPAEDKEFLKQRVMDRVESDTQERAYFATQRSIIHNYIFSVSSFARKVRNYKGKILLIWGKHDKIILLSSAEVFKALRGDIKLELISDAGHLPQQEKPAETAKLMADFAI